MSIALSFFASATSLFAGTTVYESGEDFAGEKESLMLTSSGITVLNNLEKMAPQKSPAPRIWHRMWSGKEGVFLFGGRGEEDGVRFNDTYFFAADSWQKVDAGEQTPHERANMAVSEAGLLSSGLYAVHPETIYFDDIWRFSEMGWEKIDCSTGPAGRFDHSLVTTPCGDILFGGGGEEKEYFDDTWKFCVQDEEWTKGSGSASPPARRSHASWGGKDGRKYIFGGYGQEGHLADTWAYDPLEDKWEELDIPGPTERSSSALYYNSHIDAAVLFAGEDSQGSLNDFWIFQRGIWSEIEPYALEAPDKINRACAAYHAPADKGVIFGGRLEEGESEKEYSDETWAHRLSTSGVYTSGLFDAGEVTTELTYENIDWSTEGFKGEVRFQFASSEDPLAFDFKGPDGSSDSYYKQPGEIESHHENNRYFRYRFFLECDSPGDSDVLKVVSSSITYNHLPSAPTLAGAPYSSASDGGLTGDQPLRLAWFNAQDRDNDPLTYRLQVAEDKNFSQLIKDVDGIEEMDSPTVESVFLEHGGPYYWRVKARDGSGAGEFSGKWSVYVDTVPPAGVDSVSASRPDINGAVKLKWNSPDEGELYRIRWSYKWEINSDARWSGAEEDEYIYMPESIEPDQQESVVIEGLDDDTTYWFSVRLEDKAGNLSEFSPSPSCKTNSPPEIKLTSRAEGEWGTATEEESPYIFISWDIYDPDPEDYHETDILLAQTPESSYDIIAATGVGGSEYKWDTRHVRNAPEYSLKLIARDQRGLKGTVSTGTLNITNYNEPPEVELISPSEGVLWQGINYIHWDWHDPNRTDTVYFQVLISTDGGENFSYQERYLPEGEASYKWGTGNYPDSSEVVVKVKAVDCGGLTGSDTSGLFEIRNKTLPPEPFELVSPSDGEFIYSKDTAFRWEPSEDPDGGEVKYTFLISENEDFTPHEAYENLSKVEKKLKLEDETIYYWRVDAYDENLVIRNSEVRQFAVNLTPPRILEVWPEDGDWMVMTGTETVKVRLNKDPSSDIILSNHIYLRDNYSESVRRVVSYDEKEHIVSIRPYSGWNFKPSRVYTLTFSDGFVDSVKHPLKGKTEFSFARLAEPGQETSFRYNDAITAKIGEDTLEEPGIVLLQEPGEDTSGADRSSIADPLTCESKMSEVEIAAYDSSKNEITGFDGPLRLDFDYNSDTGGFVEGMNVDERYLSVFNYSPDSDLWEALENDSENEEGTVSVNITRPGIYSLKPLKPMSESISEVIVYPNPFLPEEHGEVTVRFAADREMDVSLDIYTQTGEMVKSVNKRIKPQNGSSAVFLKWDGLNASGREVSSGMYYGVLKGNRRKIRDFLIGVVR